MKNNKYLFLITLSFFAFGFINIHFGLLAIVCMALPLILLFKDNKKTWCQGYCPRARLFTTCGKIAPKHDRKTPLFFTKGKMKWIMLSYFGINLLFIILSTIMVAVGKRPTLEMVRLLLFIPLGKLPQAFTFVSLDWLLHLSYRFYSMMLTTTLIGLTLAFIYKLRTWCTICPIATVSDVYMKKTRGIG